MYHKQKNCLNSCFLLLVFFLQDLYLLLIQQSSARFKGFSLGSLAEGSSLIQKKKKKRRKLAKMTTRYDSLSLMVISCHLLHHSLSFVVTRCITLLSFMKADINAVIVLGWNLYSQIALSTGSKRLPESWFVTYVFSFIFKFETAFLQKVFNSSAIV